MIIIVEDRDGVGSAIAGTFDREGLAAVSLRYVQFSEWIDTVSDDDVAAVEAFLLAEGGDRFGLARRIRARSQVPILAINEQKALSETLSLFARGFDDVVAKPIHTKELIARIRAVERRGHLPVDGQEIADILVFFDGRDPLVAREALSLPRRERRILECLVRARRAWLSKTQLFNQVYGLFNEGHSESIIESHICRLRKRLRERLAYDPIESQRYLGYRLVTGRSRPLPQQNPASPVQGVHVDLIN
jgi:DNA-binding response OmpR family regulator